jgi:hypothetical protein
MSLKKSGALIIQRITATKSVLEEEIKTELSSLQAVDHPADVDSLRGVFRTKRGLLARATGGVRLSRLETGKTKADEVCANGRVAESRGKLRANIQFPND